MGIFHISWTADRRSSSHTRTRSHRVRSFYAKFPTQQCPRNSGVPSVCRLPLNIAERTYPSRQSWESSYPIQRIVHTFSEILPPCRQDRRDIYVRTLYVKVKNMYSGIEISIFTDLPSQPRDHAKSRNQCVYLPRIAPSNYSLQTSFHKKFIQKKVE